MEHEDPCQWWEEQGRQQWLEMIERMEEKEKGNGREEAKPL